MNTPAQVHFYRNILRGLELKGIEAHVVARDYGETIPLLEELKIEHYVYSRPTKTLTKKVLSLPSDVARASKWLGRFDIDLITGFGVYDVYASALLGVPNLIFNDSEFTISPWYYFLEYQCVIPFIDNILTPSYFRQDLGRKQFRVDTVKEMAYLHPLYYTPDESILDLLPISKEEPFVILRFNSFDAVHDKGIGGFTDEDKRELVDRLESFSTVLISSEKGIPPDLLSHVINIPKSRMHDALAFARLLVTDTQTMATESALLGTPTVRCNSFAGSNDMGNFLELENNYGLINSYSDPKKAIGRAEELIRNQEVKDEWNIKRSNILNDYVDITALMIWLIERYPQNLDHLVDHPELQHTFRFGSTPNEI